MKTEICLVLILVATSVSSQAQPSSEVAAGRAESSQLRYQLRVVERAVAPPTTIQSAVVAVVGL